MPSRFIFIVIASAFLFFLYRQKGLFFNDGIYTICHAVLLVESAIHVAPTNTVRVVHHNGFEKNNLADVFLIAQYEVNGAQ